MISSLAFTTNARFSVLHTVIYRRRGGFMLRGIRLAAPHESMRSAGGHMCLMRRRIKGAEAHTNRLYAPAHK
jgi:hypothetical protein